MALTAQVVIEVDDQNAGAAMDKLNARVRSLDPAFQQVGSSSRNVMARMTEDQMRANEAARLFAETTGIQIPRALSKLLAQSSLIGPALTAAFSISAGLALIGVATQIVEKLEGVSESFFHTKQHADDLKKAMDEATASVAAHTAHSRRTAPRLR